MNSAMRRNSTGKEGAAGISPVISIKEQLSFFKKELNPVGMIRSLVAFCRKLPHRFWSFYIDSMLIPTYRPEWGKFKTWNYRSPMKKENYIKTKKENRVKKKTSSTRRKPNETLARKKLVPVPHDHSECERIRININGSYYETQVRTLNRFPNTLLGDPQRRIKHYDSIKEEYYFDRSRMCFDTILNYYQSGGIIHRPEVVSLDTFIDEIQFFQLGEEVENDIRSADGLIVLSEVDFPKNLFQRKIWILFDCADSSSQARIVALTSVFVVMLSLVLFLIETISSLKYQETISDSISPYMDSLFLTETSCMMWFSLELIVRVCACPNKFLFFLDALNVIDILSVFPYFFQLTYELVNGKSVDESGFHFGIIRLIRLVRVFRIFKLSRHYSGLKILGKTLQASMSELALLIFFIFIGVILFSSTVYFAELGEPGNPFTSIPAGFWWAVTTMTTVGYGDMVPQTTLGKIIGSLCAITGVLSIALPVPVIVANFNYFYHQESEKKEFQLKVINHIDCCPCLPTGCEANDKSDNDDIDDEVDLTDSDSSDKEFENLKYHHPCIHPTSVHKKVDSAPNPEEDSKNSVTQTSTSVSGGWNIGRLFFKRGIP